MRFVLEYLYLVHGLPEMQSMVIEYMSIVFPLWWGFRPIVIHEPDPITPRVLGACPPRPAQIPSPASLEAPRIQVLAR